MAVLDEATAERRELLELLTGLLRDAPPETLLHAVRLTCVRPGSPPASAAASR